MDISEIILICIKYLLILCVALPIIRIKRKPVRHLLKTILATVIITFFCITIHSSLSSEPFVPSYNPTVYVTDTGSCYHSEGCGYLWHSSNPMSLYDAVTHNYSKCSRCSPPVFSDSDYSSIQQSSKQNLPDLDDILFSPDYILMSICFAIILFLSFHFELSSVLEVRGLTYLSSFVNHFLLSFGIFFFPALFFIFCFIYALGSVSVLAWFLLKSLLSPVFSLFKSRRKSETISIKHPVQSNSSSYLSQNNTHSPCPLPKSPVSSIHISSYSSDSPPQDPSSNKESPSPSSFVCNSIWCRVDSFIKDVDPSLTHKQIMYLWTSYFYIVVKSINNQGFIDLVYSHFDEFAGRYCKFPENHSDSIQDMRSYYREIRPILNKCGIDPLTESGIPDLWNFISRYIYQFSISPPSAKTKFINDATSLKNFSNGFRKAILPHVNDAYSIFKSEHSNSPVNR